MGRPLGVLTYNAISPALYLMMSRASAAWASKVEGKVLVTGTLGINEQLTLVCFLFPGVQL